jgi:RNA polymerase sigma factor (sigma-70 family)
MARALRDAFEEWKARPGAETLVPLLESSRSLVTTICSQVLRHTQDAEDASQAVLLQLIDHLPEIRDDVHCRAFLNKACFHVSLNLKRSRKRRLEHERARAVEAGAAVLPAEESADAIHLHVAQLDDEARSLVVARYFERRSIQELAHDAGCSPVTLGRKLEKARESLLQSLSRSGLALTADALDEFFKAIVPVAPQSGDLSAAVLSKASATGAAAAKTKGGVGALLVAFAGAALLVVAALRPRPTEAPHFQLTAAKDPRESAPVTAVAPATLPSTLSDPTKAASEAAEEKPRLTKSAVLASLIACMKLQNVDGSWGDGPAMIDGHPIDSVAVTSLTLLSFLGAGYSQLSKDVYEDQDPGQAVKKALLWLLDRQRPDGQFITSGEERITQALAALAICEAYGMTAAQPLKEPARKAFEALMRMQLPDGSWGDGTTSAWAAEAVTSARLDEFRVDPDGLKRAQDHFRLKLDSGPDLPAMLGHLFLTRDITHPSLAQTSARVSAVPPDLHRPEYLYWYMGSLAVFHYSGSEGVQWKAWNEPFKNAVLRSQETGGLWSAGTRSATLVQSSLATLSLEVYYRYSNIAGGAVAEQKK